LGRSLENTQRRRNIAVKTHSEDILRAIRLIPATETKKPRTVLQKGGGRNESSRRVTKGRLRSIQAFLLLLLIQALR
jgi:hypothetical protein